MGVTGFETIEHTADKGIRAYGISLEQLFENAARGMFSLMAEIERYQPTRDIPVDASGEDLELTLKAWLDELLFIFEVERVLLVGFRIEKVTPTSVKAVVSGLPFTPEIEWLGAVVKAVTYHGLKIEQTPEGWAGTVIFDV